MTKNPEDERDHDQSGGGPRIVSLRLDSIRIRDRREYNDQAINDLAVSMRDIGLINPVSVAATENKDGEKIYLLYGGTNRCKAAKLLGWKRINGIVLKGDKDELRLCEISENLFRNDPVALERSELINEYIEIVNRKAGQIAHPGGQQPHDKGISQAAKALHLNREKIRRAKMIAALPEAVKHAVREAKLSNSQTSLLKIAKKATTEEQVDEVKEIVKRKKKKKKPEKKEELEETSSPPTVPEADLLEEAEAIHARDGDFEYLKDAWTKAPDFVTAWTEACLPARELFIERVLRRVPTRSTAKTNKADDHE